ncbi:hypothetical protein L1987_13259 [Smallanthus sonchifolius]|uniref:Uncharacterized protein n=1 Tax=Smallanthus sonchifolius TaxID=185202 RepID=A0ACB9JIQ4_9ASTR|nr:hypothetical protein L1987_13259 [Smallanthus sonchifolius]
MFKQPKVNLPFIEVLQHMPKYGKFLKDLLSNKKKLERIFEVSLSEQCSTVVQNKLPEKLADSGLFTIPCLLGGLPLNHALADLGASINLMPYSVYKKLDLGEPQSTCMSISLADRSVKYPRGNVENLLVKVGKFFFPVDFVILDMEVDEKVPLILGRPFLRTAKELIYVFEVKLTLRVGDDMITFDAMKSVKDVGEQSHSVCMIDAFMDEHWDSNLVEDAVDRDERGMIEDPPDCLEEFENNLVGSRPPRKRTCALIDSSDLGRMQTPIVGTSRGDKLLRDSCLIRCEKSPGMKFQEGDPTLHGTRGTKLFGQLEIIPSRYARRSPGFFAELVWNRKLYCEEIKHEKKPGKIKEKMLKFSSSRLPRAFFECIVDSDTEM